MIFTISNQPVIIDDEDFEIVSKYAWCVNQRGYFRAKVPDPLNRMVKNGNKGLRLNRKVILLHRVIMGLGLEADPTIEVDHINRNKLDNRKNNLRFVDDRGTAQNVSRHKNSSSIYRGVCLHKRTGKWQANAQLDGKLHYLGLYETELEAAQVAEAWRLTHMPYAVETL